MTITLQAVNELIASLESAGELSIREQKFLKLAKAYHQLAAENVALNEKLDKLALWPGIEFYSSSWEFNNNDGNEAIEFMCDIETPATDRIVAGIKADGVEEFAAKLRIPGDDQFFDALAKGVALAADDFAKQLREGADK
ncbi:TPA: hypothetical protein ACK3A9_001701 [Klebsiella pneumoniae]